MTTVQEIMRSVSEVLTTAEELNAEGDSEQVGIMLASFLRTLLVDLDRMAEAHPETTRTVKRRHRGADQYKPPEQAPVQGSPSPRKYKGKPKRPVINKYDGDCAVCLNHVGQGAGFVLPNDDPKAAKRWNTYCQDHNPYA